MSSIRFLSAANVRRALPMRDTIDAMKTAYGQLSAGQAAMPLRSRTASEQTTLLTMPAYLSETEALAVKTVAITPANPTNGLPMIHAMVILFDVQTGRARAIMEGGTLTAIRTGAGAGAATEILARSDCKVAAIIGSGVQARTQLEAVCTVREIEQVYVYSSTRENAQKLADELAGQGAIPKDIIVSNSADEAVATADIICAATTSTTPVFDGSKIKEGAHINGVGSYTLEMKELDATTLQRSLITFDQHEAMMEEAGEIVAALASGAITPDNLHAEIGTIINGEAEGRTSETQITFFKSVGVAVQDAAAAHTALLNAERDSIGTLVDL